MDIINRTQLAKHFKVSLSTIDSWIRRGCPAVSGGSGKGWQFDPEAVQRWKEEQDNLSYAKHDKNLLNESYPATVFLNCSVLEFSKWLSGKLSVDQEQLENLCLTWFSEKPSQIKDIENTLNDWLKNGAQKR